jgi:hypothetical protein
VKCPKERTLAICSEGKEVELVDFLAQLIVERMEDGTLRKADAIRIMERIERLYYALHEYVTSEEDWLW